MTREEEIFEYLKERNIRITSLEANSIIEGITWADENPKNGKELLYVAQKTAEITKKEVIIKACGWLEETDFDMEYWNIEQGFCKSEFIEDFEKAME